MQKEALSARQFGSLLILHLLGSTLMVGVNDKAGRDAWIAAICAFCGFIPQMLLYARIMKLYPQTDLFDIATQIFGKIAGKIITVIYIWYTLHIGSMVIRYFGEFLSQTILPSTPMVILLTCLVVVSLYLACSGASVFGKWGLATLPILLGIVVFTVLASFSDMDFSNLLPVMDHSIKDIAISSYGVISLPFAEAIFFVAMGSFLKKGESTYKFLFVSVAITTITFIIVLLRNLMILDVPLLQSSYFPSYITARVINIGDFLTRLEGTVAVNFMIGAVTKVAICIIVLAKGITQLFGLGDYKKICIPAASLLLAMSSFIYANLFDIFATVPVLALYNIPFQIVLPVIIWIGAELKKWAERVRNAPEVV